MSGISARLIGAAILAIATVGAASGDTTPPSTGFRVSFAAGGRDADGRFIGGTELRYTVAHQGRLYAGNGYWEDRFGSEGRRGAQILALDAPEGSWKLDHEFDEELSDRRRRHLAISALCDIAFATDETGRPLPQPVSLLVTSTWDLTGARQVFVRDDANGTWAGTMLAQDAPAPGFLPQVRSFAMHRDRTTGADHIFAGDTRGVFAGVYDAASLGRIRWRSKPELDTATLVADRFPGLGGRLRISSFAEANGVLYAAVGQEIFRRDDGVEPQWRLVYTNPRPAYSQTGLRGLTAIANPSGGGQVLLAAVEGNKSRIVRIDPRDGSETTDLDLDGFLDRAWGTRVSYVIAAYNDMTSVADPAGGTALLIGIEAFIPAASPKPAGHEILPVNSGLEAGAWYLVRHQDGRYDLHRVAAGLPAIGGALVATRTIVVSPFPGDARSLYLAGYDANGTAAHNTAWIARTSIATAFANHP